MGLWSKIRDGIELARAIDAAADEIVKVERNMAKALNDRTDLPNEQVRHASDVLQPVFKLAAKLSRWIPG